MIEEVDEALRGLVRREALNGSDVEVVFDAPTRDWAARRNAPPSTCTSTTSARTSGGASAGCSTSTTARAT
jgi:hypothetical protein